MVPEVVQVLETFRPCTSVVHLIVVLRTLNSYFLRKLSDLGLAFKALNSI